MKKGQALSLRQAATSFDDRNLSVQKSLDEKKTVTSRKLAMIQAVKTALVLRQTDRTQAFVDATQDAQTATASLSAAQLATQTLLSGIEKADRAQTTAQSIRDQLGTLARQAYQTAETVASLVGFIDAFAGDLTSRVAQSELVSPRILTGAVQAQADAQAALAAVLAALQNSVRAYAEACLASEAAAEPVKESKNLLKILLQDQPDKPNFYGSIKNITTVGLYPPGSSSIGAVARNLDQVPRLGLLNLLSAVKCVALAKETIHEAARTEVILEVSETQNQLETATQSLAALQAAFQAASSAIE